MTVTKLQVGKSNSQSNYWGQAAGASGPHRHSTNFFVRLKVEFNTHEFACLKRRKQQLSTNSCFPSHFRAT